MRVRRIAGVIAIVMLVAVAAAIAWLIGAPTPTLRAGSLVVELPAHEGVLGVARRLETTGAIRSAWAFVAIAQVRGTARALKAGEYEFPRGANVVDIVRQIESGRVRQHTVLHPEGATVAELARVLESERLVPASEVLRVARDPTFLHAHGIEGPSVEGYLFPDTYQFVRGLRPEEILGRMVQRLHAKVGQDVIDRARQRGLTLHQLLTLASIIEREAVARDELRLISAVFWNRLRRDMPLQADPTVQYAVGKDRRTLTRADLQSDDAYNTYRHVGLPPGPIASPGLPAIDAALDPVPVKYLYFVAVDERHHHFSATIEEHAAAVARYRVMRAR